MYKFVFVILHYMNIKDTYECVNSIKKLNYSNFDIIIVDNNSPNKSGQELKKTYKNDENIHIILSEKNLGFAKGNNLGFTYAKKILKADFICQINNDTIIEDRDFVNIVVNLYAKEKYYIAGPDIISLIDGVHQNPLFRPKDVKRVINTILGSIIRLFSYYLGITKYTERIFKHRKKKINNDHKKNDLDNNSLHGCCWIFSPMFICNFDGMYGKTYMYGEEAIMFFICNQLDLKYIYIKDTYILHKEGGSTKTNFDSREKGIFYFKNHIKSYFLLLSMMLRKNKNYLRKQLKS